MSASTRSYLRIEDVVKTFPVSSGNVTVLKHIFLSIQQGEWVSIVGKSGSGKSTLLNMITGIDHPTHGLVEVAGTELHRLSESQMAVWRGRQIGIVFQFFQLLPMLSLLENVLLPMDLCNRIGFNDREKRARDLLDQVGLSSVVDKLPAAVSGGQQQAAAIARALANDPPLIVADEPTGNLDEHAAKNVLDLFEGLVTAGKTVLIVTHDPALTARTHRTIVLCDGEVIHPQIASAFPWMSHPQLLQLTHLLIEPGRSIQEGDVFSPEMFGLLVVTSGRLAVIKQGRRKQVKLAEITSGQAISAQEMDAMAPKNCILQALEDSQLLEIPSEAWGEWLAKNALRIDLLQQSCLARRLS